MDAKASKPIIEFGNLGKREAPPTVLVDEYGVDIPNVDQRQTDIHGRPLQPKTCDYIDYVPQLAPKKDGKAEHEKVMRRLRQDPFTQREVDEVRYRVMLNLARSAVLSEWDLDAQPKRHLWFKYPGEIGTYEMREGNAPADVDRPKHLRGLSLHLDIAYIPEVIREFVRPGGRLEEMAREALENTPVGSLPTGIAVQSTIAAMAKTFAWRGGDVK